MTWKPESDQLYEMVDINATINSAMTSYNSGFTNKFKQSQGTTYGDWGFPEAAPLVFPTLDIVAASDHEEAKKFKDKVKKKANFVANYYDKRATAKFVSFVPYSVSNLRAFSRKQVEGSFHNPSNVVLLRSEIVYLYKSCTGCLCMLIGLTLARRTSRQPPLAERRCETKVHVSVRGPESSCQQWLAHLIGHWRSNQYSTNAAWLWIWIWVRIW